MKPVLFKDPIIIIIGLMLLATVTAFSTGAVHYPYGILVLLIFLVARIIHLRNI